jgi:transaldolase
MPEKTLEAMADHGVVEGDTITGTYEESNQVLNQLDAIGISYDEVVEQLEQEGVDKFVTSWSELLETVQTALDAAKG